MTSGWALIQQGWNSLVTGMSAAWTIFTDSVVAGWNSASNWVSKRWIDLMETDGPVRSADGRGGQEDSGRGFQSGQPGSGSGRPKTKLAATGQSFEDRKKEIEEEKTGALKNLEQERVAKHRARQEQYAADLKASQDGGRCGPQGMGRRPGRGRPRQGRHECPRVARRQARKAIPDIAGNLAAAKASVVGTFSGEALRGLGTGVDVQEKMENHLAEIPEKHGSPERRLGADGTEHEPGTCAWPKERIGVAFVIEQFGIRTVSGDPTSAEIPYAVWGAPTSEIARAMAVAASPPTYTVNEIPLFRKQATVEEKGPESHIVNIAYGPIKPPEVRDYKFAFDTTGGRQKITQSLQTIHKYAPPGKTAADHKGAIGVTDHGVEGCEIVVPKFSWSETWQLPIDDLQLGLLPDLEGDHRQGQCRAVPRVSRRPGAVSRRQGFGIEQESRSDRDHLPLRPERRRHGADHRRHHGRRQGRLAVSLGAIPRDGRPSRQGLRPAAALGLCREGLRLHGVLGTWNRGVGHYVRRFQDAHARRPMATDGRGHQRLSGCRRLCPSIEGWRWTIARSGFRPPAGDRHHQEPQRPGLQPV